MNRYHHLRHRSGNPGTRLTGIDEVPVSFQLISPHSMSRKKRTKRGNAGPHRNAPLTPLADPRCNLPNVCRFLSELSPWLQQINTDYRALRIAVCNVEAQAFSASGVDAKPPRFCSGLPNEPAPPIPFGYT